MTGRCRTPPRTSRGRARRAVPRPSRASRSFFSPSQSAAFERGVERLLVVARVVQWPPSGSGTGTRPSGMKFFRRTLRRIHAQLARQHVERAFDEVRGLRPAGAAIRVGRRLVGEHFGERRANRRNPVRRARHQHRQRRDGGGQQHVVGADVRDDAQLQAEHRAIALRGHIDVADEVAAVGRRDERLGPILNPLHRQSRAVFEMPAVTYSSA